MRRLNSNKKSECASGVSVLINIFIMRFFEINLNKFKFKGELEN